MGKANIKDKADATVKNQNSFSKHGKTVTCALGGGACRRRGLLFGTSANAPGTKARQKAEEKGSEEGLGRVRPRTGARLKEAARRRPDGTRPAGRLRPAGGKDGA